MNLKGKSFLKLLEFTPAEIEFLLDLAADLKEKKKKDLIKRVSGQQKNFLQLLRFGFTV